MGKMKQFGQQLAGYVCERGMSDGQIMALLLPQVSAEQQAQYRGWLLRQLRYIRDTQVQRRVGK